MKRAPLGLVVLCVGIYAIGCSSPRKAEPVLTARVVQLAPAGSDSSCLQRSGGTRIGDGLSDDDVAVIEALIRRSDSRPIVSIEPMPPVSTGMNATAASFRASTGVGCHGPLSGHGGTFHLKKADRTWTITRTLVWAG
jgi:hypothetical protein